MKLGDLVGYDHYAWRDWVGIIVREIPGTENYKMVAWSKNDGWRTMTCQTPKELVLISASTPESQQTSAQNFSLTQAQHDDNTSSP